MCVECALVKMENPQKCAASKLSDKSDISVCHTRLHTQSNARTNIQTMHLSSLANLLDVCGCRLHVSNRAFSIAVNRVRDCYSSWASARTHSTAHGGKQLYRANNAHILEYIFHVTRKKALGCLYLSVVGGTAEIILRVRIAIVRETRGDTLDLNRREC